MYKSLCGLFSLSGVNPRSNVAGSYGECIFNFIRYFQNVFRTVRIQTSGDVKLKAISLELIFKAGGPGYTRNAHAPLPSCGQLELKSSLPTSLI